MRTEIGTRVRTSDERLNEYSMSLRKFDLDFKLLEGEMFHRVETMNFRGRDV